MRIVFVLAVFLLCGFQAEAAEGEISISNKTNQILGIRIQNVARRVESYELVDPYSSKSTNHDCDHYWLSAQLVTGSYEIDCCKWERIKENERLVVDFYNKDRNRCYCKVEKAED